MLIFHVTIVFIVTLSKEIDTEESEYEENLDDVNKVFKKLLANLPDDTFLDTSDWSRDNSNKASNRKANYFPDCSYVDDILDKNQTGLYFDIVISPLLVGKGETNFDHYIRVIFRVDYAPGDMIRLYESIPSSNQNKFVQLVWESPLDSRGMEYVDSNVFYDKAMEYTAEYIRHDGQVIARSRYYHDRPSWMWCMKGKIESRALGKLFLPGTHDSGSYMYPLLKQNPLYVTKIYYNYIFTQEDSVFSQLMQGARTLDLRIAKYSNCSSKFYVNHNGFRIRPLKNILDQVMEFLSLHPYEIILLDLHNFPKGFVSHKDHDDLSDFIKSELRDLIYTCPSGSLKWEVTMNEMWETNGRIIIAYNNDPVASRNGFYPGVRQIWGAKDELSQLEDYMNQKLPKICEETINSVSCAMVELTPRGYGIAMNKYKGLRYLASKTNSLVTNKFIIGSWGVAIQAAAVDFIASTGIVTAAIIQNLARTQEGHPCH